MERVLIATRGVVARRLVEHFRSEGIETVAVFSEPDVEAPWVEDADYQVYLRGHSVDETYMDPVRIVEAAMDAGCDAIHPGVHFLANRPELADLAVKSNLPILGVDPKALLRATDRSRVREAAARAGLPLVPASPVLEPDDDGVAAGALLGFPLYAKSVVAGLARRVASPSELVEAVAAVRAWAGKLEGDSRVFLEREVGTHRVLGTLVVVDHEGTISTLGHSEASLSDGRFTWIEELGTEQVPPELSERLHHGARALAEQLDYVGIGRVSWLLMPDGARYFLGFSARLPSGYALYEQVFGVDLLQTQLRLGAGEALGWGEVPSTPSRCGLLARVVFGDPRTGQRDEAELEEITVPEGVYSECALDAGFWCTPHTEPVLATIIAIAPTRQAAVVRLRDAVEHSVFAGLATNQAALLELLGHRDYWLGKVDSQTLPSLLAR